MTKKYAILIIMLLIGISGAIIGLNLKKQAGGTRLSSESEELTLTERQVLEQVRDRFASELLTHLNFDPLFKGDLFVKDFLYNKDFLEHPEGWARFGLDRALLPKLDRNLLERFLVAQWNFRLYSVIYFIYSEEAAKRSGREISEVPEPEFVTSYFEKTGKSLRAQVQGLLPITNPAEVVQILSALEELNPPFKEEIKRRSLTKTSEFLQWLEINKANSEKLTRKKILDAPAYGLSKGTPMYLTSYASFVLGVIQTKEGFKIRVMVWQSH